MEHLHSEFELEPADVVQVNLDAPANVMLMDYSNYDAYRNGRPFRYFGGHAKTTPVQIPAPGAGKWHVVVDLGGSAGHVTAGVGVLRAASATR